MIGVHWKYAPEHEQIQNFKTKAYRNRDYLVWLKNNNKCWSCPARGTEWNPIDPSHIFRSYHGMKNHDWAAIPQCRHCHEEMEYGRSRFERHHSMPTAETAEKYFRKYLKDNDKTDNRTPDQLKPI